MLSDAEMGHLRRCVELAAEALAAGDSPYGSVLVSEKGKVLAEERNRTSGGDATRHPEFELARWAANNMNAEQRAKATVFTSGEHCAMCSAAHGWVGLGRIVYAVSSQQTAAWKKEFGVPASPIRSLSINEVVPSLEVVGPVPEFEDDLHALHRRYHQGRG